MHYVTYQLCLVDLKNENSRTFVKETINNSPKIWFQQSNDSLLATDDLLKALNAFSNENEASDLSLDELESITGGIGLSEALVSSCILMCMVTGAGGMFANSMGTMSDSKIQDALNSGLNANIESVRHELSEYASDGNGIYSVDPGVNRNNMGQKFLEDPTTDLGQDIKGDLTDGITTNETIGGLSVERTITAKDDGIVVTYTYDGVDVQSTQMVAPASGWLS